MSRNRIYLDHAATTPLDPRVFAAMRPYFSEKFGNASSIHTEGALVAAALRQARADVGRILQAHSDEIVFTSGGTESNNLAIFGAVRAREKEGVRIIHMHFITTAIEHSSVLECFRELEARGAKVSYAPVKANGIVDPNIIAKLVRPNTVLVSVGLANNEIGTIQPIREISKRLGNFAPVKGQLSPQQSKLATGQANVKGFRKILLHCDASQAALFLDLNVARLGVDLMTLDGHKMYGPKGVGMLYVRRLPAASAQAEGTPLAPVLYGGGQERGLRSTTENVPAIVGFAEALRLAAASRRAESTRLAALRDYFFTELPKRIKKPFIINGDLKERLPNNINISISGLDAEFAVLKLDAAGIASSTKSSCLGSEGASYVVAALGGLSESRQTAARARRAGGRKVSARARSASTLRFTLGRATTKKDIDYLLSELARILK